MTEQFQQVVGGADKFPLALDAPQTTEPEAAKTADFFDLSEHGFDSCFARGIEEFADRAQQHFTHAHSL